VWQIRRDGSIRPPRPSTMHGWLAKMRGTLLGNERLRNKVRFQTYKQAIYHHSLTQHPHRVCKRCGKPKRTTKQSGSKRRSRNAARPIGPRLSNPRTFWGDALVALSQNDRPPRHRALVLYIQSVPTTAWLGKHLTAPAHSPTLQGVQLANQVIVVAILSGATHAHDSILIHR
jgi:hypothetical protein